MQMRRRKSKDGCEPHQGDSSRISLRGSAEEKKRVYACIDPTSEDGTIGYTKVKSIVFFIDNYD
jgi:hypothetical protein